jgi:hypothetical protein
VREALSVVENGESFGFALDDVGHAQELLIHIKRRMLQPTSPVAGEGSK